MDTPHPSYPPLDLAASGAVVVTNRHGRKTSLAEYSKNILCVEPTVEGLKEGVAEAVLLVKHGEKRRANWASDGISRSWQSSFESVLNTLAGVSSGAEI